MSQPESRLSRRIQKWLNALDECWCFKVHGSEFQPAGIPDILGCYRGVMFGVEAKMPGNKPTKIQEHRMAQIREAGGVTVVAYSLSDVQTMIQELDDELND